jgi:RNA polymerase primary sigma factor
MARVLGHTIEFISSSQFEHSDAEHRFPAVNGHAKRNPRTRKTPDAEKAKRASPTAIDRLCETPLLSADEEQDLFRRLNYVKYRAHVLRESLDARRPNVELLEIIEEMLVESDELRNHLITANLRLVISIAKKFVSAYCSFDELVSEGVVTLVRAVEKFDYSRGFRFSTYGTHAIQRSLYRFVKLRQKESLRFVGDHSELLIDARQDPEDSSISERRWEQLGRTVEQMLNHLDDREQVIVRARFGLGEQRQTETLQSLAGRLGICKERVRQLEKRAMTKLQAIAEELNVEPLPV